MMRIESVYKEIRKMCQAITLEDLQENLKFGYSAQELADNMGLRRNAASEDLNSLFRQGKLVKIKGKPVRYFDRTILEKILGVDLRTLNQSLEIDNINNLINIPNRILVEKYEVEDKFFNLIGYDSSLLTQVEQAKASILYPGGLNMLITGPTGVGKSYFAELIYEYAKRKNVIDNHKPFVSFNCAEYADNPQLLVSQLFGHVRGAFTGADDEKEGIVEKANNGILFLDEIHRLPEEGQEMLFFLMDKGLYRKMGQSKGERKANVRIIGATTKDPEYALLKTFLRRIPIIIRLPLLEERSLEEKFQLIIRFFSNEAKRTGKSIHIQKDMIRTLLSTNFEGNIGELKGEIQFICARGFIKSIQKNDDYILINNSTLGNDVKYKKGTRNNEIDLTLELLNIKEQLVLSPLKNEDRNIEIYINEKNIYDRLEKNYTSLINSGVTMNDAFDSLNDIVNDYFDKLMKKFLNIRKAKIDLSRIIPQNIYTITNEFLKDTEKELGIFYENDILLSLSLHVQSFIDRSRIGKPIKNPNIENVKAKFPKEFELSSKFISRLADAYNISYSEDEASFVTMFIQTANQNNIESDNTNTLIIFLSHGVGIATSTKKLINQLLGSNVMEGLDMPLDMNSKTLLNKAIELINMYKGLKSLLLMVDMGSLSDFAEKIWNYYDKNIEVGIITGVNTLMILDVSRKINYSNLSMENVINELNYNDYLNTSYYPVIQNNLKKIITTCITGIGTAEKIKLMLQDIITENVKEDILIEAVELEKLKNYKDSHDIICIVGTFNPNLNKIPFIPLENLLDGKGIGIMNQIFESNGLTTINQNAFKNSIVKSLSMDLVVGYLTFLNPEKTVRLCTSTLHDIEERLGLQFENEKALRFIIHTSCMIERIITNKEPIMYNVSTSHEYINRREYKVIKDTISIINNSFRIKIPDSEITILYEILFGTSMI